MNEERESHTEWGVRNELNGDMENFGEDREEAEATVQNMRLFGRVVRLERRQVSDWEIVP